MLAKLKTIKENVREIKESGKNKCKQSVFYIPSALTFLNAICGFLSIIKATEGHFEAAAYYIILAALFDGLDGRLARKLGLSSEFGSELDSLCDAVSFCLAPVFLIYCWHPDQLGPLSKISLFAYLCAGLARLAKFNVLSNNQDKNLNKNFVGLPTTIAAFAVTSLILSYKWLSITLGGIMLTKQIILSVVLVLAILMISPISFYSFKSYKPKYIDYAKLFIFSIVLWLLYLKGYPIILLIVLIYILFNIANFYYNRS